jgi:hypothetical protein
VLKSNLVRDKSGTHLSKGFCTKTLSIQKCHGKFATVNLQISLGATLSNLTAQHPPSPAAHRGGSVSMQRLEHGDAVFGDHPSGGIKGDAMQVDESESWSTPGGGGVRCFPASKVVLLPVCAATLEYFRIPIIRIPMTNDQ